MGLFGGKDWNIIAIIFERKDLYRVNGNRGKGSDAAKMRDGAKQHPRTIYWAVFNQKRAFLEGAPGPGQSMVSGDAIERLKKELAKNGTVQQILGMLEKGDSDKVSKPLIWGGYPKVETPAEE